MKHLFENWRGFLRREQDDPLEVPPVLYHATYGPLMDSIREKGLGGKRATQYEDSVPGVVYLALDPNIAESHAESSEVPPDEWIEDIRVLAIDTAKLDLKLFKRDANIQGGEDETVEYHGIIPPQALSVVS